MKKNIKIDQINFYKSSRLIGVGFFLLFFFVINNFYTQESILNTLKNRLSTEPSLIVKADFKHSFISNQLIAMRGIKAGLNFNDSIKIGIGYSWMKNNFIFDNPNAVINNENYNLKYSYVSLFFDYSVYSYSNWNYILSSDFAIAKFAYKNRLTRKVDFSSFGFVLEPSLAAEYRLFKYVIAGGGIGYRFVLRDKNNITESFSAPLYILRVKLDFLSIYNDHFK